MFVFTTLSTYNVTQSFFAQNYYLDISKMEFILIVLAKNRLLASFISNDGCPFLRHFIRLKCDLENQLRYHTDLLSFHFRKKHFHWLLISYNKRPNIVSDIV